MGVGSCVAGERSRYEVKGITLRHADGGLQRWLVNELTDRPGLGTSPRLKDSDGDGYWDGWIGVYNASNSANVVLYMEHLRDDDDGDGEWRGDGFAPDERVPEQTGVHEAGLGVPMAGGADIDDDEVKEHSNVHLGELQWSSDPMDGESVSSPGFSIEVDFVSGRPQQLINRSTWERGIEENYALYGIDINMIRDETLDEEALSDQVIGDIDSSDGVGGLEFLALYRTAYDGRGEKYLVVANEPGSGIRRYKPGVWGGNIRYGIQMSGLFVEPISGRADGNISQSSLQSSPYTNETEYLTAFVEMHEIGHSLYAGEADDKRYSLLPLGEVYSGTDQDFTPELLKFGGNRGDQWGIMREGWSGKSDFTHNDSIYWVFSIEELSTVDEGEP